MRNTYSIAAVDDEVETLVTQTASLLPLSFRVGSAADADVIVVGGALGWPETTLKAVRGGARAVIVVDPGLTSAESVRELARAARSTPIQLAEPFAGNPGLLASLSGIGDALARSSVIAASAIASEGDLGRGTLAVLRTLRATGVCEARFDLVTRRPQLMSLDGSIRVASGACVDLAILVAASARAQPSLTIRSYDSLHSVEIHLPSHTAARPARISLTTADGVVESPAVYENSYRHAWRRAYDALELGANSAGDLSEFADDLETVASALAPFPPLSRPERTVPGRA